MKKKVAVIGTGISGMSIAYFLSQDFEVDVYEKSDYVGGHTNTVDVMENGKKIPIDTGFIVFNHVTYPNLLKLFNKLQVPTKKSDMSFSVQNEARGLEFCGSGLSGLFAQKKNFFKPSYIKFLLEINRFNTKSIEILDNPRYEEYTLGKYMEEEGYSKSLLDDYLVPMSSAVWSTPPDQMLAFPARTLVRFFYNHGFLGLNTQHQWYTVDGGSREYVKRITASYAKNIQLKASITGVVQTGKKVDIQFKNGSKKTYDRVVIATHGDTALKLLKKPTPMQKELLSEFQFQKNWATLHTWDGDMPSIKKIWSSWNYKYARGASKQSSLNQMEPFTVYWMNRLQNVSKEKNYFVTINDPGRIPDSEVIRKIEYEHPLFSLGAVRAQKSFGRINMESNIHFVGAYWRYGFHEDGIDSSVRLATILLGRDPWANL
ncbi:NAD(P)/FAD-dependent oxidoreductase [Leptospira sp. GIMC2001]|uniref:NAD(P)/FAD-dependent oxidoreductase n=1 Tax=Leptospira sp. GIMC2001 TaxID=1513297 RepID=UPI00234A1F41|nr:FAD-dependent oxidoreductase [Leptospira sp. GIMC2001]WCL47767.1 FAD-dependent oxidoreductase [Leptospira sp. GIMC2001]